MKSKYFELRVIAAALCFVAGFFSLWFFIPAFLIGATLSSTPEELHEARRPKPVPAPIERARVSHTDPEWKSYYLEACESPAESTFLTAMISSFGLKPQNGILAAPELTLRMQVGMGAYRLDFLANDWLIIEIDGATWHSSPEAVARDSARDAYFASYNFTVLRIPASVVFASREEAIVRVRAAIAKGPHVTRASQRSLPEVGSNGSLFGNIGQTARRLGSGLNAVSDQLETFSADVDRRIQIAHALQKPRSIYQAEKAALTRAMDLADLQVEADEFCARSEEHKRDFEAAHAIIGKAIEDGKVRRRIASGRASHGHHLGEGRHQSLATIIPPMEAPPDHSDNETDRAIKLTYASLLSDRASLFCEIRQQLLSKDQSYRDRVKKNIEDMGGSSCWMDVCRSE